jgi:hypothetical protein
MRSAPIDHVREEVRLALQPGNELIPVLVGRAKMPSEADLAGFPELLPRSRHHQKSYTLLNFRLGQEPHGLTVAPREEKTVLKVDSREAIEGKEYYRVDFNRESIDKSSVFWAVETDGIVLQFSEGIKLDSPLLIVLTC